MSTTVLAYLLLLLTLVSYYFAKRLYQQFPYLLLSPAFCTNHTGHWNGLFSYSLCNLHAGESLVGMDARPGHCCFCHTDL